MRYKTLFLLLLVVVLPTLLLSWGGFQLARQQSDQFENRVRGLMLDQLVEMDSRVKKYFASQEAILQGITSRDYLTLNSIRDTVDSVGVIDNIFIINENEVLAYPNPISPLNDRELEFYTRIREMVEDGEIQNQVRQADANAGQSSYQYGGNAAPTTYSSGNQDEPNQEDQQIELPNQPGNPAQNDDAGRTPQSLDDQQVPQSKGDAANNDISQQSATPTFPAQALDQRRRAQTQQSASEPKNYEVREGWFIWYWGRGVNLIFWQRLANGRIVCVALERSRWISDLIAELPDSVSLSDKKSSPSQERTTRIMSSSGETVYQWGNDIGDDMLLAAEFPMSHPLTSWKFQMWVMPDELKSQSLVGLNIVFGIVAFSIALIAVASIFFREYAKDLKEASKRVSFVNQVSHELRTPLTNIRMYAELLQKQIGELDSDVAEQARKRIEVVESESHRLSRLITNVLSFAGSQKNKLEIRLAEGVIDECVEHVLSSFLPNLERLKIKVQTDYQAPELVLFDSDALGQILGNVIGNVEKYAADGEFVIIKTRQQDNFTEITIQDGGPGVEALYHQKIFEPFWRLSNELQHASGTGIGLSISRELARMHDGDLTIATSDQGARFVIRIKTEKAK